MKMRCLLTRSRSLGVRVCLLGLVRVRRSSAEQVAVRESLVGRPSYCSGELLRDTDS